MCCFESVVFTIAMRLNMEDAVTVGVRSARDHYVVRLGAMQAGCVTTKQEDWCIISSTRR